MSSTRPATIAELAEEALDVDHPWDPSRELKHYLRHAEKFRRAGKSFTTSGDLEAAFVQFAKAATLILEKLPTHRDYTSILSETQRRNLTLNGQDILDSLSELKPVLLGRYERWQAAQREDTPTPTPNGQRSRAQAPSAEDTTRHRMVAEEVHKWKEQREDTYNSESRPPRAPPVNDAQKNAALAAARRAAAPQAPSQQPSRYPEQQPSNEGRSHPDLSRRHSDAYRPQHPSHRQPEQAAQPLHQGLAGNPAMVTSSSSAIYQMPTARPTPPNTSHPPPQPMMPNRGPPPPQERHSLQMPLERPGYDADSTESDSLSSDQTAFRRQTNTAPPREVNRPDDLRTTTSPPPNRGPIAYPKIMSQHQKTQGYIPSNIFHPSRGHTGNTATLLFQEASQPLYAHALPTPSVVPPPQRSSTTVPRTSRDPRSMPSQTASRQPLPTAPSIATSAPDSPPKPGELKTVHLPRDCFPRFLAIANLNTSRNKETCGLLLGKSKGHKYIVSTLLIPKQHSTSDTCTMDEEELVLQFTEERSLITLGWIHTHPSQSCFMSSVDLHTHSGFQRMLPESFAVVCAPKSDPSVGIFRLTDPPGLQTVLDCEAKESFHPHPDLPIYTDADRGHVQMKDIALEIVDIRN